MSNNKMKRFRYYFPDSNDFIEIEAEHEALAHKRLFEITIDSNIIVEHNNRFEPTTAIKQENDQVNDQVNDQEDLIRLGIVLAQEGARNSYDFVSLPPWKYAIMATREVTSFANIDELRAGDSSGTGGYIIQDEVFVNTVQIGGKPMFDVGISHRLQQVYWRPWKESQ